MRRCLAFVLSNAILTVPLYAKTVATTAENNWPQKFLAAYKIYEAQGTDAFIAAYEKEIGQKLEESDRKFLSKSLGVSFKSGENIFPQVEAKNNSMIVTSNDGHVFEIDQIRKNDNVAFQVNGQTLTITDRDNIQTINEQLSMLLQKDLETSRPSSWLLPSAYAISAATIAIIAVAVAVIAAIAFFAIKATKAAVNTVKAVGKTTQQSIKAETKTLQGQTTSIGGAVTNAINSGSTAANGAINGATALEGAATNTLSTVNSNIQTVATPPVIQVPPVVHKQ